MAQRLLPRHGVQRALQRRLIVHNSRVSALTFDTHSTFPSLCTAHNYDSVLWYGFRRMHYARTISYTSIGEKHRSQILFALEGVDAVGATAERRYLEQDPTTRDLRVEHLVFALEDAEKALYDAIQATEKLSSTDKEGISYTIERARRKLEDVRKDLRDAKDALAALSA